MTDDRLTIHALVTRSHEELLNEWFLRSLPQDCRPVLHFLEAPPAVYREGNWHIIFIHRVKLLIELTQSLSSDRIFIMSDVDIQFFRPFANEVRKLMEDSHLLFQNNLCGRSSDLRDLCAGFVAIRPGRVVQEFFRTCLNIMIRENRPDVCDQEVFQQLIASFPESRARLLPTRFWTRAEAWSPGQALQPPPDIVLHHANWVIGNRNKILQLEEVRKLIKARAK